jgi:hypothetical protein
MPVDTIVSKRDGSAAAEPASAPMQKTATAHAASMCVMFASIELFVFERCGAAL